jgi:acyl-CoA synthetase (AMP-forming)/AMP-acid ligase II
MMEQVRVVDCKTEDGSGYVMDTHGKPYLAGDRVNVNGEACLGRGEVLIGGNTLSDGYFNMHNETKEAYIDRDGEKWFATGDVGEWTPDGNLKIVDRKKNLVSKAAMRHRRETGEHVAATGTELLPVAARRRKSTYQQHTREELARATRESTSTPVTLAPQSWRGE